MQDYLRRQENSKTNYNLILETLKFLDCICGVTTGGLVLLSLYIHANNVELITQTLVTLTEYCQGPCHENQVSVCSYVMSFTVHCAIVLEGGRGRGWYIQTGLD